MNAENIECIYTVKHRGTNIFAHTVVFKDGMGHRTGSLERFRFILPNGRERCTETLHGAKCIIARNLNTNNKQG